MAFAFRKGGNHDDHQAIRDSEVNLGDVPYHLAFPQKFGRRVVKTFKKQGVADRRQ